MKFSQFRIKIIFRIILLSGNIGLIFWYADKSIPLMVALLLTVLLQIYLLLQYLERTHRDLYNLFEAIRYDDFSFSFSRRENDQELDQLYNAFNQVLSSFRLARIKSEEYRHFLQTVVQHVGVPLLAFDSNGNVEIINSSAKKFFKINRLKQLSELPPSLAAFHSLLIALKNGEKKNFKITTLDEAIVLAVYAVEFIIEGRMIKLVTMVNISRELDEKELESWLSLLKVLTHEIMNSMTPISSMSSSVNEILSSSMETEELLDQVRPAIETIARRSSGMVNFLGAFRSLTILPKPEFKLINLANLFQETNDLMIEVLKEKKITLNISIDPHTLQITADKQLILQVLVNLINNAAEALENTDQAVIDLRGLMNDDNQVLILVEDNGPGILEEVKEKVFIPFFTTKKMGSGIGLSLSKLIMQAHRGVIKLESEPEKKLTRFTLQF